jgi:hypothetical protein
LILQCISGHVTTWQIVWWYGWWVMPKKIAPLSAISVKQLKSPGMHAVGGVEGLYLSISKQQSKSWIFRFMFGGARRAMGLGPFSEVSLGSGLIANR